MDYAQIVLPSMRAPIGSASKTINSIFKGGKGNTTHSSFLVQSNWTGIYTDNIFKGGAGSSNNINVLMQSSCDPVYVNNIFRGGAGSSNNVNVLMQSSCDPVYVNNIFRGGAGSSNNVNVLTQSNCDPVYVNNIFRGGGGSSNSVSVLAQSNCDPVYVNNIFKGGGGYSAQSSMLMNIVGNGIVLNLDAGNTQSFNNSGNTWYDLSGNGNNGTITNGPIFNPGNGGSIVFDGVDDVVSFGNILNIGLNSWTMSCWVKFDGGSGFMGIMGKTSYRANVGRYSFYIDNNNLIAFFQPQQSANSLISTSILPYLDNKFHNLVMTINRSSSMYFYIDGISVGAPIDISSYSGVNFVSTDNFYLGSYGSSNGQSPLYFFKGNIGNATIFNQSLSAAEVTYNFNVQKNRFGQ